MPSLRPCLVVLAGLVLAGCTHSRSLDTALPEGRTRVNARAEGESARITLYSGKEVRVHSLHIAPDVTTWLDPGTSEVRSVATSELASVRFTDRGRGVVEGLGVGAAVGVGLGVLVGAVIGATDDGDFIQFSPAGGAFLGGMVFGGAGAVIGGLAGLDQGSRTVYALPPLLPGRAGEPRK